MKKKRITKTALRLLGLVIFALCTYDNDMGKVVWFVLGTAVVSGLYQRQLQKLYFSKICTTGRFS